jgi:hypothetical protein
MLLGVLCCDFKLKTRSSLTLTRLTRLLLYSDIQPVLIVLIALGYSASAYQATAPPRLQYLSGLGTRFQQKAPHYVARASQMTPMPKGGLYTRLIDTA